MKLQLSVLGTVLGAFLVGTSAFAQDVDFSGWDEDGDGALTLEEWDAGVEEAGIFDRLDENGNGVFDIEESDEGLFEYDLSWDVDDGGQIERQEFTLGTFQNFDSDQDESLAQQEFDTFSQGWSESELSNV